MLLGKQFSAGLLHLAETCESQLLENLSLSVAEQHRLASLANPQRRRDWLAGRWAARQLLGQLSEQSLVISAASGKPQVASAAPLFVSWSHSGDWLLAFAAIAGPVGCDIERHRPRPRLDALIARSFAAAEVATLLALPDEPKTRAFYALWTLKEAILKADGVGIARGLKNPPFCGQSGFPGHVKGQHEAGGWQPVEDDYAVVHREQIEADVVLSCSLAVGRSDQGGAGSPLPGSLSGSLTGQLAWPIIQRLRLPGNRAE